MREPLLAAPPGSRVRLWDAPTRLVHWALVGLVAFSWWSAEEGKMDLHRYSGYAVLGLLVFRLFWGFFGASSARFAGFVRGPGAVISYARGLLSKAPSETPGHNPLGGLSVLALLGVMIAQVSFGLFAVDIDGLESGPLSQYVDFDTGRVFAELHEVSFAALQILIVLHLGAVIYYLAWKRENLVRPMVLGWRTFSSAVLPMRPAPLWRLFAGVVLAAAAAWFVANGLKL